MRSYVVACGDPSYGYAFVGPYDDSNEAEESEALGPSGGEDRWSLRANGPVEGATVALFNGDDLVKGLELRLFNSREAALSWAEEHGVPAPCVVPLTAPAKKAADSNK